MNEAIRYRGPDNSGVWMDRNTRVGFGHNRLSIIDPSPAGNQPMRSHSGRYIITYNGEIYNHQDLRRRLPGENWHGNSDTEILLSAIEQFGVRRAIELANGMFSFALWDRRERSLTLARDRTGEKPLYYGAQGTSNPVFLFASELKAIACHPAFIPEIDREALTMFLRFGYVPAPYSIYRGIRKLPPGTLLQLRDGESNPQLETYWSAAEVAKRGATRRLSGSKSEIVDQVEGVLEEVIAQQMLADVSVGAFLSGGIDSSTIVALMQKLSPRPVKTFTVGFHEKAYNEAEHAKAVARHLGTDHTELYVTPEQARSVIPLLPSIYDEPFADSSQIPTYLVASLAHKDVKVALSGDGGDELFGGYNRHLVTASLWRYICRIPAPLRAAAASMLSAFPGAAWTAVGLASNRMLPAWVINKNLPETLRRGLPLLASKSLGDLYAGMISHWSDPASVVIGGGEASRADSVVNATHSELEPVEQVMLLDIVQYLPGDILVKVDRASMAVSLETRIPFLDRRVVELAWRLPFSSKINAGRTKVLLRELLYRYVPPELVERSKMGFGVPIGAWLRGPLRSWAEALLDPAKMRHQGYFNAESVQPAWRELLRGKNDKNSRLWGIIMFQSWLEANMAK
jgi:asparagine synthase (glutamine-hydrolysing)